MGPELAHLRVLTSLQEPVAVSLINEQRWQSEQGRAGAVEQQTHAVLQQVLEPRSPAFGPDVPKGGNNVRGDDGTSVAIDVEEGIEAERMLEIGGVEIDAIGDALARYRVDYGGGEVAVRIEQSQAAIGMQIGQKEGEKQRRLAGAGFADDVEMSAAIILVERDGRIEAKP